MVKLNLQSQYILILSLITRSVAQILTMRTPSTSQVRVVQGFVDQRKLFKCYDEEISLLIKILMSAEGVEEEREGGREEGARWREGRKEC